MNPSLDLRGEGEGGGEKGEAEGGSSRGLCEGSARDRDRGPIFRHRGSGRGVSFVTENYENGN